MNFEFRSDSILTNGSVYITGALTDWISIILLDWLIIEELGSYTTSLLLKQGYYDYQYVYVPNDKKHGTAAPFEGNYSETVNKYTIYIYYRDQGEYWDKLIGLFYR